MKKSVLGLLLSASVLGFAVNASAEITGDPDGTPNGKKTYVGEQNGSIPIQGTLGMDNTDPNAPIEEGSDAWINVTVPTQTYFYSVSTKPGTPISSPKYTITNNSGRPVVINLNGLVENGQAQTGKGKISDTAGKNVVVNLAATGGVNVTSTTKIIDNGNPVNNLTGQLGRLANNQGKDSSTSATNQGSNVINFSYNGSIGGDLGDTFSSNYTLGLTFSVPGDWNN